MAITLVDTFTLDCDSWMDDDNRTTNYGSGLFLKQGFQGKSNEEGRIIFHTDVTTSGKSGSDVVAAYLVVNVFARTGFPENFTHTCRRCDPTGADDADDVAEAFVTWNQYKQVTNWGTAGGDYAAGDETSWAGPAATGWFWIDIKDLVIDALDDRSGILGVIITIAGTPAAHHWSCRSMEYATAADRPYVEIFWSGTNVGQSTTEAASVSLAASINGGLFTTGAAGDLNYIIFYSNPSSHTALVKCAIYDASGNLLGTTDERAIGPTAKHWMPFKFAASISLSASTSYYLVAWSNGTVDLGYDTGTGTMLYTWANAYDGFPDPYGLDEDVGSLDVCIYGVYVAGAAPPVTFISKVKIY